MPFKNTPVLEKKNTMCHFYFAGLSGGHTVLTFLSAVVSVLKSILRDTHSLETVREEEGSECGRKPVKRQHED